MYSKQLLLFIEHKKKQCQMTLLTNSCFEKMNDWGGGEGSPPLQSLNQHIQQGELKKVVQLVEIGIQVTPEEEKLGGGEKKRAGGIYHKKDNPQAGRNEEHL